MTLYIQDLRENKKRTSSYWDKRRREPKYLNTIYEVA